MGHPVDLCSACYLNEPPPYCARCASTVSTKMSLAGARKQLLLPFDLITFYVVTLLFTVPLVVRLVLFRVRRISSSKLYSSRYRRPARQ